jgi:beta-fructofuranosidase/levanase
MAWMNNWQYAEHTPTSPWRGAMALPRQLELRTVDGRPQLVQNPVDQLESVYGDPVHDRERAPVHAHGPDLPPAEPGQAYQVELTLRPGRAEEIGLRVHEGADQATVIGYDTAAGELFLDRSDSGDTAFHHAFPSRSTVPLPLDDGRLRLRVVVDTSSVEVFAADGRATLTDVVFPGPDATGISLYADGGRGSVEDVTVRPLGPAPNGAAE